MHHGDNNLKIKILIQKDWKNWRQFRLDVLKNSPENFGSSYEEESTWPDSELQNTLVKNDIFGAFIGESLVSCAGFYILNSLKTKHRGII